MVSTDNITKGIKNIIFIIIIIFLMTSCYKEKNPIIDFNLEEFQRNEVCNRRFDIYVGEIDGLRIGFAKNIYKTENINEVINRIIINLREIEKKIGERLTNDINIYILETTLDNGFYIGDNDVYCTIQDIENGIYTEALIRACYNLTEPWIIHGLNEFVFENDKEISYLTNYYNNIEDMSILGLFGGRFYKYWNSDMDIKIAMDTATSLVTYLINYNYKDQLLGQNINIEEKNNWLKSIGVDRNYNNIYDGELNDFTYSKSKDYSMIIKSKTAVYHIRPIDSINTIGEIEKFLYKDQEGRAYILEYLRENCIENYSFIRKDAIPTYFFYPNKVSKKAASVAERDDVIKLGKHTHHLHEYAHLLIQTEIKKSYWQHEGIAEYLSMIVYPNNYYTEIDILGELELGELSEYYSDLWNKSIEYYIEHGGNLEAYKVDRRLYVDSTAYNTFESCEVGHLYLQPIYEMYQYIPEDKMNEGNELSYIQAASFTAYLIEHYTLDKFIEFCNNDPDEKTFEEIFNISYKEAKERWISYLGK